ncbi:MAG: putative alkaline-shock protein [Brockia lithotrophica]|uniref:Putative alkaline-shock protein n=1 Tax=Brockia lithotrophica TaxID=933949 RepID=A0A2T5G6A1_9BACL|nr:MAG: putative alkaline-shock protein [Brockia lithotrophica]
MEGMPYVKDMDGGKLYISDRVIAQLAGYAAMDVFGIVGMVPQKPISEGLLEILGRENLAKGVEVVLADKKDREEEGKGEVSLNLYAIVTYGVRIPEVARNLQERVLYALRTFLGIEAATVNVHVRGVKVES